MNPAVTCQRCGVTLSALSNDGLCAACMLRSVFDDSADEETPAPATRLALPRTFGTYELLEELGRGGMGVVYRARQLALDRIVALKLLLGGVYSSEAMLRRFQIEAAAAAALRHPGIVAIHDYGEFEGQPYYTMELMEGRNLAQVTEGRPLEMRRAARYLREIADAVRYAHGHSILHRDLKPSNILIDHDDRARVADFGMAKRLDLDSGVTLTGQLVGSPNYAAPEQVSGREKDVGVATDIYALGALLYHLLTGRPPFLAATLEETLRLLHGTEPVAPRELNPSVPRDLETICLKCLAKEPGQRYPTAAALVEDLDRFLSDRPIQARPPSIVYRARKYARRNRTIVIAATAVFGSLVVGLGVALAGYRRAVAQQRATQAARAQAEELVGVIMRDLQPALEPYGRLPVMGKIAEASLHYFEQLPPELQSPATDAAQATALDSLALVRQLARESEASRTAKLRATELWKKVLAARPDDPEAAAALLIGRIRLINWFGTPNYEEKYQELAGLVARGREMRARFPNHPRVKFALASALAFWSYHAASGGRMEGTLAAAREGHALLQDLLGALPGDPDLQVTFTLSFMALGVSYQRTGDTAANIRTGEEAVAFVAEALKKDPGNLSLLQAAAEAAHMLGTAVGPVSASRAREAEATSRSHLATLIQLDPANRTWRFDYAQSFATEASFLRRDGQTAAAWRIYSQTETLMLALDEQRPVRSSEWTGPRGAVFLAGLAQAECAALLGERADAQAWLEKSAARCAAIGADPIGSQPPADWFTLFLWGTRVRIAESLGNAAEIERTAQAAISAIDAMPVVSQWNDADAIRKTAMHAIGRAKLRQGDAAAAVPLLQGDDEALAEALTAAGDTAQARKLLEPILAAHEAAFAREPDFWETKINLARTSCLLAKVLDPAKADEATRRQSLLDRAAGLLDGPDAETRLTPADRELKAQIATERGTTSSHS
jgi:hypothetical protein